MQAVEVDLVNKVVVPVVPVVVGMVVKYLLRRQADKVVRQILVEVPAVV
jgi:hypothetical protein